MTPVHPLCVSVEREPDWPEGKRFVTSLADGTTVSYSALEMTHVVGPSTDGLRGISLMRVARNSIGTALAGDRASARMFGKGAMVAGVLTPRVGEDLSVEDVEAIKDDLTEHVFGSENAGSIPIVNRALEFTPWQMTNSDAQFLESRAFSIEEVSRWTGVPPHLLFSLEKSTSWGTGIAEQNKNLAQYVLNPWASRLTARLSRLLAQPRFIEFDFAGLEAGSAKDELTLLMAQVNGGFLTLNEARKIRNLPPVEGGDSIRTPSGVMLLTQLQATTEA